VKIRVAALVMLSLMTPPGIAAAELACPGARGTSRQWPAPLDRVISLREKESSLRTVLGLIAAAARVRLSYASELLPLDRRVCAAFDSITVGDALSRVLDGTVVEPVVAGASQVVLAPVRRTTAAAAPTPDERRADLLERVVVTGSVDDDVSAISAVTSPTVISGRTLVERGATSLADALNGAIPGVWAWSTTPGRASVQYASVRGASSFGVSAPKIYIDGVEVANPLLLTQLTPETIDRVEVIRGPQGAAIYGADAISGVINITTRHEGVAPGERRAALRTTAGMSSSEFAPFGVLAHEHVFTVRGGTNLRSGGLGLSLNSLGAYIPGAFSRQLTGTGDFRVVGARGVLTGTARLFSQHAATSTSPLLAAWTPVPLTKSVRGSPGHFRAGPGGGAGGAMGPATGTTAVSSVSSGPQAVREYTFGMNGSLATVGPWTPSLVVGIDGYRLSNVNVDEGPIPSAADSALTAARGGGDRGTLRLSTVGRFRDDGRTATVTLAAEHSLLRDAAIDAVPFFVGGSTDVSEPVVWRSTTGLSALLDVAVRRSLFVTAGLRLERDAGYTVGSQFAALPMLGAAYAKRFGGATLRLRTAYGKAIRPARTSLGTLRKGDVTEIIIGSQLAPEQQSGIEAGFDLGLGRAFGLHVTRFDQTTSGLVQPVMIAQDGGAYPGSRTRRVAYQLQNVGQIANRGWEMQGTTSRGPLSIVGSLSLVDSRVQRVASGYSGDLRTGDRMLGVPARTASLTATWAAPRWLASWTLTRAANWVNYDRLAVVETLAGSTSPADLLVGDQLRDYWRTYSGVTRLGARVSRDLFRGISLVATGDNVLGQQRGEPDNITIVPGRTITFGFQAKF
jgi:iron complex outermembrane recepter protein